MSVCSSRPRFWGVSGTDPGSRRNPTPRNWIAPASRRDPAAGRARPPRGDGRRGLGRAPVVALGPGWNEVEFRTYGIPFDRRVARFGEAFEIVGRLPAGERVTFAGAYETVADAVLLPKPARRPPLMVGGTGPRLLAATLPHVQAWDTWFDRYGNTPDGFAALNGEIDEAARAADRDPASIDRRRDLLSVQGGCRSSDERRRRVWFVAAERYGAAVAARHWHLLFAIELEAGSAVTLCTQRGVAAAFVAMAFALLGLWMLVRWVVAVCPFG